MTANRWVCALVLLAASCAVDEDTEAALDEAGTATPSDEPPTPGCVPWIVCNTVPTWYAVTCDPAAVNDCDGLEGAAGATCRPDGLCAAPPPAPGGELCPNDADGNGLCWSTNGVINMLLFGRHDEASPQL